MHYMSLSIRKRTFWPVSVQSDQASLSIWWNIAFLPFQTAPREDSAQSDLNLHWVRVSLGQHYRILYRRIRTARIDPCWQLLFEFLKNIPQNTYASSECSDQLVHARILFWMFTGCILNSQEYKVDLYRHNEHSDQTARMRKVTYFFVGCICQKVRFPTW